MNKKYNDYTVNRILELNSMLENIGISISLEKQIEQGGFKIDSAMKVTTPEKSFIFALDIKKQLADNISKLLITQLSASNPTESLMFVADYITPSIESHLIRERVSFINFSGKVYIHQDELLLYFDYPYKHKPVRHTSPAFEISGLKLIFHLLNYPESICLPYQKMAKITGISTGSISLIISDLRKQGFVYTLRNKRLIRNQRELLEHWWIAYGRKMRQKTVVGRYRKIESMRGKKLPDGCQWGGESAAELMNNNFSSQTQTIYTKLDPVDVVRELRLIPDETGELELLAAFWSNDVKRGDDLQVVSLILVYADLMLSQNDRNIEIANEIIKE